MMIFIGAFGVGIDAPNAKFILHDRSPFTLNDCIQESGRSERLTVIGECSCTKIY